MLGPGGFDATRDIAAITVNRWSHGYSWTQNTLVNSDEEGEQLIKDTRSPLGNISFGGSELRDGLHTHNLLSMKRTVLCKISRREN